MTIPHGNIIMAFKIEGFGTSEGRLFFSDGLPAYITPPAPGAVARWRPVVLDGFPNVASSVDFYTGAWTIGSMDLRLRAPTDIFQLCTNHIKPVAIDTLGVALSILAADPVVFASGSPTAVGNGDPIQVGRESILLGLEGPAGTFTGNTRGAFETEIVEHDLAKGQDISIYDRQIAPTERRVTVGFLTQEKANDPAASDADFQVYWAGTVDEIASSDSWNTVTIQTLGIGVISKEAKLYTRRWRGVVRANSSGLTADQIGQFFVVQKVPRGESIPTFPLNMGTSPSIGDVAWVRFGASACAIEYRGNFAIDGPMYKLRIDLRLIHMPPIALGDIQFGDECWEILTSVPESRTTGPIGFNALPLGNSRSGNFGDVLTILLQILLTTERGFNSIYDLKIKGLGPGIPQTQIAISEIEALRGEISLRSSYTGLYIGKNDEPDNLLDFIQRHLLAPFFLVMAQNGEALWTVKYLRDLPALPPLKISDDDLVSGSKIGYTTGLRRQVDTVEFKYQGNAKGETKLLDFINETNRERRLNAAGSAIVEAIGLVEDEGAKNVAQVHVWRRREMTPEIAFTTKLKVPLKPGDPFEATSSQLIDVDNTGTASKGVVDQLCYVSATTPQTKGNHAWTDIKAIVWGLALGNLGRIGNALEVVAGFVYDGVGSPGLVEFTPNKYQSPVSQQYPWTVDVEPFEPLDVVRQCDEFGDEINDMIEIGSVNTGTNEITFSIYPISWDGASPPLAGEIFQDDGWNNIVEHQEQYVHRAKLNGFLGTANDDGFNWAR